MSRQVLRKGKSHALLSFHQSLASIATATRPLDRGYCIKSNGLLCQKKKCIGGERLRDSILWLSWAFNWHNLNAFCTGTSIVVQFSWRDFASSMWHLPLHTCAGITSIIFPVPNHVLGACSQIENFVWKQLITVQPHEKTWVI